MVTDISLASKRLAVFLLLIVAFCRKTDNSVHNSATISIRQRASRPFSAENLDRRCSGARITATGTLPPMVIKRVDPDPSRCRNFASASSYTAEVLVGTDGQPRRIRVIKSGVHRSSAAESCVHDAIVEALKRWLFCPAVKDGQPVEATMQFTARIDIR